MDGGHESFDDGEVVVENLGEGGEAVGSARSVTDDGVGRVVRVKVNTCVGGRDMRLGGGEMSGRKKDGLPHTYMGASALGAEMMTFLAPPTKWSPAFSLVVKTPVDSTT